MFRKTAALWLMLATGALIPTVALAEKPEDNDSPGRSENAPGQEKKSEPQPAPSNQPAAEPAPAQQPQSEPRQQGSRTGQEQRQSHSQAPKHAPQPSASPRPEKTERSAPGRPADKPATPAAGKHAAKVAAPTRGPKAGKGAPKPVKDGNRGKSAAAPGHNKTTICHATGSATNPYVTITIPPPAVTAHARHQDGRDIIPMPAEGCPGEHTSGLLRSRADASSTPEKESPLPVVTPATGPKLVPSLRTALALRKLERFSEVLAEKSSRRAPLDRQAVAGELASSRPVAREAGVAAAASPEELPFTGSLALMLGGLGLMLIGAGVMLRRGLRWPQVATAGRDI